MRRSTPHPAEARFDFDEWARLASDSPVAFEERRRALLHAAIDAASPERRPRLEGVQWRIDQVRRKARTPMAASLTLYSMMWDAVLGENGLRDSLVGMGRDDPTGGAPEPVPAKVVAFRRPGGSGSGSGSRRS